MISTEFPFQSYSKRNGFKRLENKKGKNPAYKFAIDQLPQIFPLFFFSKRFNVPGIYLITANGSIEIAMNLCDDGNLHISYHKTNEEAIKVAAQKAGLQTGDTQLCSHYSICHLS